MKIAHIYCIDITMKIILYLLHQHNNENSTLLPKAYTTQQCKYHSFAKFT